MNNFINRIFTKNSIKVKNRIWINISLFFFTILTTIFAGTQWSTSSIPPYQFSELISKGLPYSISILFIITFHEFGHYFAAKYHKVRTTLPYYIPFPPIGGFLNFGTMGAVIKIEEKFSDNIKLFDIGIFGPISGFFASILVLIYGFSNLPGIEYLLSIHPNYFSQNYAANSLHLEFGNTILYFLLQSLFTNPNTFVPPMSEMYHYPFLITGWFGLLITSMNLMPVGQLDGGHIIYSMFGHKIQEAIGSIFLILLFISGTLGFANEFLGTSFPLVWSGWLFWGIVLYFFIKIKHPPVMFFYNLDLKRKILGYFAILMFLLTIIPVPFSISF